MAETLGVADAKRRFSELIERVRRGERFIVLRRGKPAVALVPPDDAGDAPGERPIGLAAIAGALGDWTDLEEAVSEIYASRRRARDRAVPEVG